MSVVHAVKRRLPREPLLVRRLGSDVKVLGRGFALVLSDAPQQGAVYFVLIALNGLVPVFQVWLMKRLVDALTAGSHPGPLFTREALFLAELVALAQVIPAILQPIQEWLSARLQDRSVAEVDRRLIAAGRRLADLGQIERPSFHDELHLVRQAASRPSQLCFLLGQVFSRLLTLGGVLFLLVSLQPLLPLVLLAGIVPHLIAEQRHNRRKYETLAQRSPTARAMEYCVRTVVDPTSAKEVRVYGLGPFFRDRFRELCSKALGEVQRLRLQELRLLSLLGALHAAALGATFWYVGTETAKGRLSPGDLVLYLGALIQAEGRIVELTLWLGLMDEMLVHFRGLFAFLDNAHPLIRISPRTTAVPFPPTIRDGIALRDVHFGYPEGAGPVLDGVSATLPAEKITALVGLNGSGKSTLVKLLTRLYDPDAGAILIDDVPLSAYDLDSLRRGIAVVYQDFARFALTLRENITVGAAVTDSTTITDEVRRAGVDEVAARLPKGYETQLTRRFAEGVELSGGEWQRVALARAFVRDAALIILDEPTAALDAAAEERLFLLFRELITGKTGLLISHRLSTVKMADQIIVLDQGRIVEAGSHGVLAANGGDYARLFALQAAGYQ